VTFLKLCVQTTNIMVYELSNVVSKTLKNDIAYKHAFVKKNLKNEVKSGRLFALNHKCNIYIYTYALEHYSVDDDHIEFGGVVYYIHIYMYSK